MESCLTVFIVELNGKCNRIRAFCLFIFLIIIISLCLILTKVNKSVNSEGPTCVLKYNLLSNISKRRSAHVSPFCASLVV